MRFRWYGVGAPESGRGRFCIRCLFYRLFGIFDDVLYVGLKGLGLHLFGIANRDTFRKWFAVCGSFWWFGNDRSHNRYGL